MIELPIICVMVYIPNTSNEEWQSMWLRMDNILHYHICLVMPDIFHIRNENVCGTEQSL